MIRCVLKIFFRGVPVSLVTALLLVICLLTPVSAQGPPESHIILLDSYPPYYQWKNGKPYGPLVDVTVEAFRRMGTGVEFQQSTWVRALFEVENGGAAGVCAGAKIPKRELFAIFPEEPLAFEENWVATRAGSIPGLRSIDDLQGRTIGVVEGYTYGVDFDARSDFQRRSSLTEKLLLKQLLAGRVDIIVGSRRVLEFVASQVDAEARLEFHFMIDDYPLYLLFSRVRPESKALAQGLDDVLRLMRKDGTIQRLQTQYNFVDSE